MLNIGVIGGSSADNMYRSVAESVGHLLASKNVVVLCGGKSGVMEWVSKGVKESGGVVVGILPGLSPEEGNSYLSVAIPTGIGYARNFLIVRASDALIAIDGSTGTLSEASFALTEGKSVISIGELNVGLLKNGDGKFFRAQSAMEAVDLAIREATMHRKGRHPSMESE